MTGVSKPINLENFNFNHVLPSKPRKLGDIEVDKKYIKKKKPKPKVYKDKEGYTVIDIPKSITKEI
tara:strand:- start:1805 stop:2002 length:198 start_codon:yes stop_codon:yes gene_type:complete